MKKALLIVIIVFLSVSLYAHNFAVGGKVGSNLSSFYGGRVYGYIFGLNTGLVGQYKLGNHFYLKTELNFEQKGRYTSINSLGWFEETTIKLNYLSLPVLAKITIGKSECFYFNMGPYLSYLLKASNDVYITESSNGELVADYTAKVTEFYKKFDFGLGGGLGVSIDIYKQMELNIDARYDISLTPLYKTNGKGSEIKNQSINLNCGILINLK